MRYADWQKRFWDALDAQKALPFKWGERDCVLFAASMADVISDGNYVQRAKQAFTWTNAQEAAALTETPLIDLTETVLGSVQRWQTLSIGDIVAINDDDGRQSLCIHDGVQLIGVNDPGYRVIPVRYARGGWRVE